MREQELDFQGVFRIPAGGGDPQLVAGDFEQPNGLCFSPDEKTLYIDDSGLQHIRQFSVSADGTLSGGEVLLAGIGSPEDFDAGVCDGMKCDEQGNIWVTGPGGIWVVSPEGEHLGTVEIPEHTSNLNWGGPGWDFLYVCASSSVYRFRCKLRGNRVGYMREAPREPAPAGGELDRLLERGWAITREMFGDEVVDARIKAMTDLARPLDEYVTAYCFGDIWARPGLTRKMRSILTIAILITLGKETELKGHIRGGLVNGVTWDEIGEIILHAAAYSGIPSAVGGLRAARDVQESLGEGAK